MERLKTVRIHGDNEVIENSWSVARIIDTNGVNSLPREYNSKGTKYVRKF